MATDNKIRGVLAHRLEMGSGDATMIAKLDYAGTQMEEYGTTSEGSPLYGFNDKKGFAMAISRAIENDPPSGVGDAGMLGGFKVVATDKHQLVYGADLDGLCLSVVTGVNYPSRVAIKMLQELYTEFMNKVGPEVKKAKTNGLSKKSKNVFTEACKKYDDLGKVDKVQALLGSVDKTKEQMQSNIAGMLKNQEKAEVLEAKSANLQAEAQMFKKNATEVKKTMQWKNFKQTLICFAVIALIVGVLLFIIL